MHDCHEKRLSSLPKTNLRQTIGQTTIWNDNTNNILPKRPRGNMEGAPARQPDPWHAIEKFVSSPEVHMASEDA